MGIVIIAPLLFWSVLTDKVEKPPERVIFYRSALCNFDLNRIDMQTNIAKQIPITPAIKGKHTTLTPRKEMLAIHTDSHIEILRPGQILFVKAESNYSIFHLVNGTKLVASKTLGTFESFLGTHQFLRCHQSYIVNLRAVQRISKCKSMELTLVNEIEIPVSRRNRKSILNFFSSTG